MSTVSGSSSTAAAVVETSAIYKNDVIGSKNVLLNNSECNGLNRISSGSFIRDKKTTSSIFNSGLSSTPPPASPLLGTSSNITAESQANADYRLFTYFLNKLKTCFCFFMFKTNKFYL